MKIKIFLIILISCWLANNGFTQSTPQKLGEKTRQEFEKAKNFVCDSTGPVKKVIKETGEKAKEVWDSSDTIRKKALETSKKLLNSANKVWENTEPQREAAAEKAKQLLKKTEEAAKEFKEGWKKEKGK